MSPNVEPFLRVLDPADTSTGGGTASALAGAMSAALAAMVARLSLHLEHLAPAARFEEWAAHGESLSADLLAGADDDTRAFEALRAAYRLPKQTDAQKAGRREAVQHAVLWAAQVPLANAERCRQVLDLCARLRGRSNENAASDLECAGHLALAGLLGCLANVEINLPLLADEAETARLKDRVAKLRDSTHPTDIERLPPCKS